MRPGDRITWRSPNGNRRPGTIESTTRDSRASDPDAIVHITVMLDHSSAPLNVAQLEAIEPLEQVPVRLDAPGAYDVLDADGEALEPPTAIVRTEWEGPEGGKRALWEVASWDQHGWTIHGDVPPGNSLREARENLWLAEQ